MPMSRNAMPMPRICLAASRLWDAARRAERSASFRCCLAASIASCTEVGSTTCTSSTMLSFFSPVMMCIRSRAVTSTFFRLNARVTRYTWGTSTIQASSSRVTCTLYLIATKSLPSFDSSSLKASFDNPLMFRHKLFLLR